MFARAMALALTGMTGSALVSLAQSGGPLPPWPSDVPAGARLYTRLTPNQAGRMAAWRDPDGTLQVVYQHHGLAGCEVNVRSTITVDAVGVPIRLQHTGQTCDPRRVVNETYSRSGSTGRWQNAMEHGEGDTTGKKFYMSLTDVPEERAQLVRALLASGNRLDLLPNGEARLERVQELAVRAGGRTETITHYRIYGLGLGPSPVWLDGKSELFALTPDFIRQGWEAVATELARAQSARLNRPIISTTARPPS